MAGLSAEATDVISDFLPLAVKRSRDAVQSDSSSYPHAAQIKPVLDITLNLRIAVLSQLGRLESLELDWKRLRSAVDGEGVNVSVVLCCDEEEGLGCVTEEEGRERAGGLGTSGTGALRRFQVPECGRTLWR